MKTAAACRQLSLRRRAHERALQLANGDLVRFMALTRHEADPREVYGRSSMGRLILRVRRLEAFARFERRQP